MEMEISTSIFSKQSMSYISRNGALHFSAESWNKRNSPLETEMELPDILGHDIFGPQA